MEQLLVNVEARLLPSAWALLEGALAILQVTQNHYRKSQNSRFSKEIRVKEFNDCLGCFRRMRLNLEKALEKTVSERNLTEEEYIVETKRIVADLGGSLRTNKKLSAEEILLFEDLQKSFEKDISMARKLGV